MNRLFHPFERRAGEGACREFAAFTSVLGNSGLELVNRVSSGGGGAAGGGGDGAGGGKYIMPLVKLSFYDHFMVARGPSMLSTYRCAFLAAVLWRLVTDLFRRTRYRNIVSGFREPNDAGPVPLQFSLRVVKQAWEIHCFLRVHAGLQLWDTALKWHHLEVYSRAASLPARSIHKREREETRRRHPPVWAVPYPDGFIVGETSRV